jgi:hypothetical protein
MAGRRNTYLYPGDGQVDKAYPYPEDGQMRSKSVSWGWPGRWNKSPPNDVDGTNPHQMIR